MRRDWKRILGEGLIAGLLGYAIVAVIISVADLVQGRSPFHTAAMLGSTVFFGLRDPAELVVWPGPVFAYNGMHLGVFLLLGAFMAWLASLAEGGPQMWYVALVVFLIVVPHAIGAPIWFEPAIRTTISLWLIVLATAAAAVGMMVYLWRAHPGLRQQLAANDDG
jgi:hypothetical protein